MNPEPLNRLIRSLHKLAGSPDAERLRDEQLLERFVTRRDRAAFELLLWRHGPMVLGVCRRVLHAPDDAEDAFQATWLTFIKKAAAIVRREAVGSWLYQVAYRVALRARAGRAKRAAREHLYPERLAAAPAGECGEAGELGRVLDEEVNRLPALQRAAFVLCCLEGRTGDEAARELGCPPGTVSSRLTRARKRLRHRLTRRGLAPVAAALTGAAAGEAWSCPLPAALADNTMKAALLFSSGEAAGGVLSRQAITLSEGVLRAMFVTKVKIAAMILLAAGVLAGGGVLSHHALTAAPPAEKEQPAQLPKPAPKGGAVPAPASAQPLKEAYKQQLEAAQKVYKQNLLRYRGGLDIPISELCGWSERCLEAEIMLSDTRKDRTDALKAHVDRTREVERIADMYMQTGQGKKSDAAAATYYRVSAEIRFMQGTGELPPPSPKVKTDDPLPQPKAIKQDNLGGEPLRRPKPKKADDRP